MTRILKRVQETEGDFFVTQTSVKDHQEKACIMIILIGYIFIFTNPSA